MLRGGGSIRLPRPPSGQGQPDAAGNLSLTPIYESYSEILNLLRTDKPAEAKAVLAKVLPVQQEIISCIENNMD